MDDSKTVFCGNLSDRVTEEILFELFLQAAPLQKVKIPTDKEGRKSNFGFITFKHEESVEYALQLLNGIQLYDKCISVKPRNGNSGNREKSDFSIKSRLGFPLQNHLYDRPQENRESHDSKNHFFDRPQESRESHDLRNNFRDHYKDESSHTFRDNYRDDIRRDNYRDDVRKDNYRDDVRRDNYRDDVRRDNSFNKHEDKERQHDRYDSNRRRNFNDRRGNFDRGHRNRHRPYLKY